MKQALPAGTIARTTDDQIIILATEFDQYRNKQVGQNANGRLDYYEVAAAITEFTPSLLHDIQSRLPRAVFVPRSHGYGLTGSDPEVFAFTASDKPIPAWNYLKESSKSHPTSEVYWDGVQAEFTVWPRACHEEVTDNVQAQLKVLWSQVQAFDPAAILRAQDVVRLDRTTLATSADEHIMLGCSPSKNAYGPFRIDIPDPRDHPWRYAGTHLHHSVASYPTRPSWWPDGVVVAIDKIAGLLLTALGRDWEDPTRRKTYGRAGEYRLPGGTSSSSMRLEYRTPGAYVLHHPAIFNFAADMTRTAYRMGLMLDGRVMDIPDVQSIINECDADAAVKVINEHAGFFEQIFSCQNYSSYDIKATFDTLISGAKASGRFANSLANNWYLGGEGWRKKADCKWRTYVTTA